MHRGRMQRSSVAGVFVLGVSAAGLGLWSVPSQAASPRTVTVAVEGPMSGSQASTGIDMARGAELEAGRLNAQGGVLGRRVKILRVDDKAEPSAAVPAARRAVASGAAAVIGPFNSSVGVKNLPTYRRAGLGILRLTSDNSTQGYGITTQPMANQVAPVEAQELTGVLHATSVDVLYDPSTYTAGIASQLVGLLRQSNVQIGVNRSLSPTATGSQQQAAVQAVTKSPASVVYLAMYSPEAGALAKRLAAAHAIAPPSGSSAGTGATSSGGRCFVDLAAQGPDFVSAAGKSVASACLNSGVPSADQLPGGSAYVTAYQRAYHSAPGTWGAFTYDSLGILAAAVRSSGQWRGTAVRSALGATQGYQGVTGTTTIQLPSGNRANPPVVILSITPSGNYTIDTTWSAATHYGQGSPPPAP